MDPTKKWLKFQALDDKLLAVESPIRKVTNHVKVQV